MTKAHACFMCISSNTHWALDKIIICRNISHILSIIQKSVELYLCGLATQRWKDPISVLEELTVWRSGERFNRGDPCEAFWEHRWAHYRFGVGAGDQWEPQGNVAFEHGRKARGIFMQVEKMGKEWCQQHAMTLNYVLSALGNGQSSGLWGSSETLNTLQIYPNLSLITTLYWVLLSSCSFYK